VLLELIAQFFSATMAGKRDFLYLSVIEVIASAVSFVYVVLICCLKTNIYFLAYNQSIVPLVTIIGGFFYFKSRHLLKIYRPALSDYRKYISYSLPLAFSSICERALSYLDKLVLGNLLGAGEVGFYQIALQCYAMADRLIKPVTTTIFTEIVHRIANAKSYFHKGFKDLVEVLNFAGGLMVIVIIFAAKNIIQIFFGAENLRAAFILQFFALTVMGRLFWRPYNNVIFAIEKHKLIYYLEPLAIAAMIACYYLLIPVRIGQSFYLGAAALPITEFITWVLPIGFLRIVFLKKAFGNIHIGRVIWKIWLPLIIVVCSGIFIYKSILMLPAALAAYVLIEYFLQIVTIERIRFLAEPVKQICKTEI
jgi:O-antigen/teichoic acid export membrane protein